MKKVLSVLLSLALCLGIWPVGATAAGTPTRTERLELFSMTEAAENAEEGWKWEPSTNTLTLKNCYIKMEQVLIIRFPGVEEANLVLEGNNIIETSSDSDNPVITSDDGKLGHLKVSGSGSMTVTETTSGITKLPYIFACKALTIEGGATVNSNMQLCIINNDFTLDGGSVTLKGEYVSNGIYVNAGDVIIKSGNLDISGGKVCMFLPGFPPTGRTNNVKISGGTVKLQASTAAVYSAYQTQQTDSTDNLEVTGGNVQIDSPVHVRKIDIAEGANLTLNTQNGLAINSSYNIGAKLASGTYGGSTYAIQIADGVDLILADLLAEGFAYFGEDGKAIALTEGQKNISGPVTVKKCGHEGATAESLGDGTHRLSCPYCGHAEAAEKCAYQFSENVGTCSVCGDQVAVEVTGTENLVYDGTEKEPVVTVKRGEIVLVKDTDYTVAYENNENRGNDAKVKVTMGAVGTDQGTYIKGFSIKPAALTVTSVTADGREYDGTNVVNIKSVALEGVKGSDQVSVGAVTGTISGSDANTYTSVTLPTLKLTGADAGNYTLTQPSGPVSANVVIAKAAALMPKEGDMAVSNSKAQTYTFGLGGLRPDAPAGKSLGSTAVTYTLGAVNLGDKFQGGASISGQTLTLEITQADSTVTGEFGTIGVTIITQNYADMNATIKLRAVDKSIPEGAPTLSAAELTYGQPLGAITLSGKMSYEGQDVPGRFEWGNPENHFASVGTYAAAWKFTPTDNETYAIVNGTSDIKVVPASIAGAQVSMQNMVFVAQPTVDKLGHITVTLNGKQLSENDYDLSIEGSKVVVTGKGNYTGTASGDFEVASDLIPTGKTDSSGNDLFVQVASMLEPIPTEPPKSVDEIKSELRDEIGSGFTVVFMNVRLVRNDGTEVRSENEGIASITVTLPYPAGTGPTGWDFAVKHMKHNGSIEDVECQPTSGGLECTFASLSPVAIGYKAKGGTGGSGGSGGGGGGWVRYYLVKILDSEHGGVTADHTSVRSGDTVTLSAAPEEGFELEGITVTDSSGKEVELTEKDGSYSFIMPASDVTVSSTFRELPSEPWVNPFPDVSNTRWYIKAIEFVCSKGLMAGYTNGRFGPDDTITRAQFAQIIYTNEGMPESAGGRFADVKEGQWYADAVNWAAEKEIAAGVGGGKFAPGRPITREQLVTMLWRYAGSPEPVTNELDFSDAGLVSGYAWKAVCWANENGIMRGRGDRLLDPKGRASRAEAAQMLMKYLSEE